MQCGVSKVETSVPWTAPRICVREITMYLMSRLRQRPSPVGVRRPVRRRSVVLRSSSLLDVPGSPDPPVSLLTSVTVHRLVRHSPFNVANTPHLETPKLQETRLVAYPGPSEVSQERTRGDDSGPHRTDSKRLRGFGKQKIVISRSEDN